MERCPKGWGVLFSALGTYSISKWPLLQFQCPKPGVPCQWTQFDNIKVFYHPVSYAPKHPDLVQAWAFYIARPGASESQCIKWAQEGINITTRAPNGKWE